MIINQFKGRAFSRSLAYVVHKPGARFLGCNVFYGDLEDINKQLHTVAHRSAKVQRPMMHFAISLAPGEWLKDHQWRSLGKDYLERMGYDNNQYILVKHTDTPNHEHVHLIVNRVRWSGTAVNDSWDYYRSQRVVRELEAQYQLMPVRASWEPFSERLPQENDLQLPDLPAQTQRRMELQDQLRSEVNQALATRLDLERFIAQLESRAVQVKVTHRQQKAVGIAFDFEGEHFTGRQLGKGYSLPGLLVALKKPVPSLSDADQEAKVDDVQLPNEPPFYHRYYLELVEQVRGRRGANWTQRQVDFQIAAMAVMSKKPDAARALVYSPDVQRLKQEQGEAVAMDYLRELMQAAQRQLIEVRQQSRERQVELERE